MAGFGDLRSTLHPDGADPVETLLAQVAALSEQVHPTALEVLVFIEVYLKSKNKQNAFNSDVKYFVCSF